MSEIIISQDMKPIAFLIGNRHQEMIAGYKISHDFLGMAFTSDAFLAHRFKSTNQAKIVVEKIVKLDKSELVVVPLFDLGDKLAVIWP
jgi:hypothetical protein